MIIRGIVEIARALDITVLAEGVELESEVAALREAGVSIFQGYLLARPEIETFRSFGEIARLHTVAA